MPNIETHPATRLLSIRNQLSEIPKIGDWLELEFTQSNLPADSKFKLDLCAEEAVTNIITHAFPDNGDHEISLKLSVFKTRICLEIRDDGIPFNPLDAPEHVQPANLEEAKIGGLGIALIRKLTDECAYGRENGKNVLRMSMRKKQRVNSI